GEAVGAVAVELALEVMAEPVEIGSQRRALVVSQIRAAGLSLLSRLIDQRVPARLCSSSRWRHAGVQIEIEADCAAILRTEAGQLPQPFPAHAGRHYRSPVAKRADSSLTLRRDAQSAVPRSQRKQQPVPIV